MSPLFLLQISRVFEQKERKNDVDLERRVHCSMATLLRDRYNGTLRDVIKFIGLFPELDRNANSRKSDRRKRRRDFKIRVNVAAERASAFETESELNPYLRTLRFAESLQTARAN